MRSPPCARSEPAQAEFEAVVAAQLAEQTRRADPYRYEYERLSRSRAFHFVHRIRTVLSKLGLGSEYGVRSVDEIESSLAPGRSTIVDD